MSHIQQAGIQDLHLEVPAGQNCPTVGGCCQVEAQILLTIELTGINRNTAAILVDGIAKAELRQISVVCGPGQISLCAVPGGVID